MSTRTGVAILATPGAVSRAMARNYTGVPTIFQIPVPGSRVCMALAASFSGQWLFVA